LKTDYIIRSLLPIIFLGFSSSIFSQDFNTVFREAQRLEESGKEGEALKKYQEALLVQPSHIAALCKVSELQSMVGSRQADKHSKLRYYTMAKQTAETALKIHPDNAEANFVMSVAMGRVAQVASGQDKISAVMDIKKYAERAVHYDPANYKAYHVLGKWHFEVSSLNSFEKMGVKLLFGGFPPSSFAESIKYYEKSRSLNPAFALNYLEVAKAYHKNNQDAKAIEVLKKLPSVPAKTSDEIRIRKEGNAMLKALQD
jgi:tetratricopeptide (TPR) repeat protein